MKRLILPLLTVLLSVGMFGEADAAVLCANASGLVFLRATSCIGKEQQIDLVALGLVGPPNDAYTFTRRSVPLTGTPTTVAELVVAPGSYVINAYAFINNLGGGSLNAPIICSVTSGGAFDLAVLPLQPFYGGTNISDGTLSFNSVANLPSGGKISLNCYNNNGSSVSTAEMNIVRLTAVRAASVVNQ